MAGYFTEEQLADLYQHHGKIVDQYIRLQLHYQVHKYKSERGREHAFNGFNRRLGILVEAVGQVFKFLPPERKDIPGREELLDATIAIQAFVFNVVGCLDNLAWIWVCEKDVKAKNGAKLNPKAVGLGKIHVQVRDSFPSGLQEYLESLEPWFEHIKNFRDALAHRIPLYIPPYVVKTSNAHEVTRLDQEANAAFSRGDLAEYNRLIDEQRKLGEFRPWMTHSFYEQAPHIVFHPQLISDYGTVDELGTNMLEALQAP